MPDDSIRPFVKAVNDYLDADHLRAVLGEAPTQGARPEPWFEGVTIRELPSEADLREIERRELSVHHARAEVLRVGRDLAPLLESIGHDSTGVVRVLHAAERQGPAAVRELWPDTRASLERFAIRSGLPAAPAGEAEADTLDGYASADWLELKHGIRADALSKAKNDGKVKSKPATPGTTDSQGRTVRLVYRVADAMKHCKPKRRTKESPRRKLPGN